MSDDTQLVALTADIVAAYVSRNATRADEIAGLVQTVHQALKGAGAPSVEPAAELQRPAVPVKKSVTPDYIVCLEDGRRFKSLKRHLASKYDLSPAQYRAKWGLPADYPMVAPNYAAARSEMAKRIGLGAKGRIKNPVNAQSKPRGRSKYK